MKENTHTKKAHISIEFWATILFHLILLLSHIQRKAYIYLSMNEPYDNIFHRFIKRSEKKGRNKKRFRLPSHPICPTYKGIFMRPLTHNTRRHGQACRNGQADILNVPHRKASGPQAYKQGTRGATCAPTLQQQSWLRTKQQSQL